jgi:hypothetical protein
LLSYMPAQGWQLTIQSQLRISFAPSDSVTLA